MAHLIIVDGVLPSLDYLSANAVASTNGTHTHSFGSFGTADPTRVLIATVYGGTTLSGTPTIGGVTGHLAERITQGDLHVDIWTAAVPTATSGSVVLPASSGTNWSSYVGLYAAYHLLSQTPTGVDSANNTSGLPMSVAVQGFGFIIATVGAATSTAGPSWSGVSQDYSNRSFSGTQLASGASFVNGSTSQTRSLGCSGFSGGNVVACCASFR